MRRTRIGLKIIFLIYTILSSQHQPLYPTIAERYNTVYCTFTEPDEREPIKSTIDFFKIWNKCFSFYIIGHNLRLNIYMLVIHYHFIIRPYELGAARPGDMALCICS